MADAYITVPIETDEQTLADAAVEGLQAVWVGWEPSEGDLEVIQIEALAPMAADAAATAAIMPDAAFKTFLQELYNVVYDPGVNATVEATFTLVDAGPYTIEAGTEIDVDGYVFTVDEDTVTSGLTEAAVPMTAADPGVAFNDLAGDNVTPITSTVFIESVALDAPTAGGTDPESDQDFRDRGSRELELQAKTLVTTRDYELLSLSRAYVGRAIAISDAAAREIVVVANTVAGANLSAPQKAELEGFFEDYRLSNWKS